MTDPIRLQRQLHAATERARELEARLDHLEERFAELRAQSMSGHADLTRMVRVEHASFPGATS